MTVPRNVTYMGMPHRVGRGWPLFLLEKKTKVVEPLSLGQTKVALLVPSEKVGSFLS